MYKWQDCTADAVLPASQTRGPEFDSVLWAKEYLWKFLV